MANRLYVNANCLDAANARVKRLAQKIDSLSDSLLRLSIPRCAGGELRLHGGRLNLSGRAGASSIAASDVRSTVKAYAGTLNSYAEYIAALANKIATVQASFSEAENMITLSALSSYSPDLHEGVCSILGYGTNTGDWTDSMRATYFDFVKDSSINYVDGATIIAHAGSSYIMDANHRLVKSYKDESSFTHRETSVRMETGKGNIETKLESDLFIGYKAGIPAGKIEQPKIFEGEYSGDDYVDYEREATIVEVSKAVGISSSILSAEGAYKNGGFSAKGSADVLAAEARAAITGGFYTYTTNASGETVRHFAPGISAEAGASVSVFKAEGSTQYNLNDYVAITAEGEIDILSAEAETKVELGIVDNKLNANLTASAELDLVSAGGDIGLDVIGIKGEVGGEVKVGIGVHADVGYSDGVLKFDVGAALGVGLDARVSVDIGGLVDNVADGVQNAYNGLSNTACTIGEGISVLGKGFMNLFG